MVDTEITLIKPKARVQDAEGVWHTTAEAPRTIFARMDDVNRSEFFGAGQVGMSPEYRIIVNPIEYEGERVLEWNGRRYAIYRSYHVPGTDDLELYAQREVGVQRGT
ncbi:MAG: hypothetical protein J6S60_10370 [Oscillospiraceae bacterium]|nr:hypothetical protein [Oscillospiraceae bacterium]